ncbi:hypothetical protein JCM8202v2_005266 [Rhodotorula sphaerocarpa]
MQNATQPQETGGMNGMAANTDSANRSQLFENYVYYAAEAARIARDACEGTDAMQRRIETLESELQIGDQIAYCVLDGDGCIFHRDLISKGREGGREAARLLTEHVQQYAEDQGVKGQLTVVIHIFVNKQGLGKVLAGCDIADDATFSAFLLGLNAAHPGILVSDVGGQKEASDAKLSHSLRLYAKLPSTKVVIAGAAHDGGYAHLFSHLETESPLLFRKITLLKSYLDSAFEIKRLSLRTTFFEGLFEPRKLVAHGSSNAAAGQAGTPTPRKALQKAHSSGPPGTPGVSLQQHQQQAAASGSGVTSGNATPKASGGGPASTPKQPVSWSTAATTKSTKSSASATAAADDGFTKVVKVKLRPTDPTKPLFKQVPPVCNQHYLNPPCHENCRYGHQYALTGSQLVELKANAQKSPCTWALKGRPCHTPGCPLGHVCPHGKACKYGDTCRFSTPGLHPPGTPGRKDGSSWKGPDGFGTYREEEEAADKYAARQCRGGGGGEDDDSGFETTSSID